MQNLPYILITEDDLNIATTLRQAFRSDYQVDIATTGKEAIYKTDSLDYELIILDLGLPDMKGLNVCQLMRERGLIVPILVLSGTDDVMTKISLLDAGANDFLSKPFSLGELKARMRVLLRDRAVLAPTPKLLEVGDLTLNRHTRTVLRNGQMIGLRRKEFSLLECLMENANRVVTRELLTTRAWEDNHAIWTNTVDVHIKHLRDKIDRPFNIRSIKTVHGLGYKLDTSVLQVIHSSL